MRYKKDNIRNVYVSSVTSFLILLTFISTQPDKRKELSRIEFYKIGHRGARGLMPENTIPAFEKGISSGANTIEFDVHITKDSQVVIYHDASFNPEYTLKPDGSEIHKNERKKYTFFQMNYADIKKFIIGVKRYEAFSNQELIKTYTPLLTEMIDSIENFTQKNHYQSVVYLLEIKSNPATDGYEQPPPDVYVNILMEKIKPYLQKLKGRLFIQSFDLRPLQILHKKYPDIPLGFLVNKTNMEFDQNIKSLGFVPALYNPEYHMVNREIVHKCHKNGIKIFPWTVNDTNEINRISMLNVDGIITDYPNLLGNLKK